MKRRSSIFVTGAMALAMILVPFAGGPSAQAGNISIVGGGGGGGGGNTGGSDAPGTGGGGGGGVINTTNPGANGSTGAGAGAGTGGTGGAAGATVGTGGPASNIGGGSNGAVGGDNTSTKTGGAGGNAVADATDMGAASVGAGDNVTIRGGNGGNGGVGNANGSTGDTWLGWIGGNGGKGGDAELDWGTGSRTIQNLDVIAGNNGNGSLTYTQTDGTLHGSGGGQGGYASFYIDGNLTTSGAVNVISNGNYAEFTSTGVVNTTGATTVRVNGAYRSTYDAVEYHGSSTTDIITVGSGDATMTITGFNHSVSSVNTLTIETTGSGDATLRANNAASVRVTGGTQDINVRATSTGDALLEARAATITIQSGNLNVSSSNAAGTAKVDARLLSNSGKTNIDSYRAEASISLSGDQLVTAGELNLTAHSIGDALFTAANVPTLQTDAINVIGQDTGDALVKIVNGDIHTTNYDVNINADAATGGIMGIETKRLETGTNTAYPFQQNNGTVTLTNDGGGAVAQLKLTDSLQTKALNLTGDGTAAAVNVNVAKVDVTKIDTVFNFDNTGPNGVVASTDGGATGVYFKTIELGSASNVRTLYADTGAHTALGLGAGNGADLGTYWADSLLVNVTTTAGSGQQWVGDIWLGGSSYDAGLMRATGTVGKMEFVLPAGVNLNDYVGDGMSGNPNYMLTVSGGTSGLTLENGASIKLAAASGNPFKHLNQSDVLQLINTDMVITNNAANGVPITGVSELGATNYNFNMRLSADQQKLLAEFLGGTLIAPLAKTYLQGTVAALGTLNLGAELENRVIRNTFDPNVNKGMFKDGYGMGIMFGAEYTDLRLNSGSHVDSDNFNVVIGPAFRSESPIGELGVGLFFEAGYGDYSTYNSFSGLEVISDGDTKYYGGGIGLRNDFAHGIYVDLSMRSGSVETDLKIKNRTGARYDMTSNYFGGHVGLGKIFDFEENGRLDLSTRLLWTHLGGDDIWTDAEERLSIDDTTSLRTQLGARYSRSFSDVIAGYVGGAWEYESDGTVSGRLDGVRINESSTKGSTGIAELGISITPVDNFSIDLGLHGYTGKREGGGGTAMMSFSF